MKKGLLVYKAKYTHKNIGDYVQSIAAEQYTGRDVTYLEREHLHEYTGEPLQLIMNGWFMHLPKNWPPSENIVPLLRSMHINPDVSSAMLSEKGIAFLKRWGPVGCRDRGTLQLLQSKGVPAYFSGCLTLTLGKTYKHNPASSQVCFVDPFYQKPARRKEKLLCLATFAAHPKTVLQICKRMFKKVNKKNLLQSAAFYKLYAAHFEDEVLTGATYIKHMMRETQLGTEENKLDIARDLLSKYANSKLVVTSRIHAALPCLGMGTPVIFVIHDDIKPGGKGLQPNAKGRFDGLLDLFHVMQCLDNKLAPVLGFTLQHKISLNRIIQNKQNHLQLAAELDKSCTEFIQAGQKVSLEMEAV